MFEIHKIISTALGQIAKRRFFQSPLTIAVIVFCIALLGAYLPVHSKGYSSWEDSLSLIQARNKALAGTFEYESADGIFLSSAHASNAITTSIPNSLTPIIYAKVFSTFGFRVSLPSWIGAVLFAVSSAVVFILSRHLFGDSIGALSGGLFALSPVAVTSAGMGGFYEWGLFFFVLGLFCYLGSQRGPFSASSTRIAASAVFFSLAALSRNAFAVTLVPLLMYDLYATRSIRRFALLIVPIALLFGSTLTPYSWLGVGNGYLGSQRQPFQQVGHFFNDPYSAVYDRDASIRRVMDAPGAFDRVAAKFARQWGFKVPISARLIAYRDSFEYYVLDVIAPWQYGGPLVIVLVVGGYAILRKRDTRLAQLFAVWGAFWLLYLVYDQTANWDHYIELLIPVTIMSAIGIRWLYETIAAKGLRPMFAAMLIGIAVIGTLGFAAKWRFSQLYNNPVLARERAAEDVIRALPATGVVAVGIHGDAAYEVAYTTNRDIIYFHPETVRRLADEGRLNEVLRTYDVRFAVGYDNISSAEAGVPVIEIP